MRICDWELGWWCLASKPGVDTDKTKAREMTERKTRSAVLLFLVSVCILVIRLSGLNSFTQFVLRVVLHRKLKESLRLRSGMRYGTR